MFHSILEQKVFLLSVKNWTRHKRAQWRIGRLAIHELTRWWVAREALCFRCHQVCWVWFQLLQKYVLLSLCDWIGAVTALSRSGSTAIHLDHPSLFHKGLSDKFWLNSRLMPLWPTHTRRQSLAKCQHPLSVWFSFVSSSFPPLASSLHVVWSWSCRSIYFPLLLDLSPPLYLWSAWQKFSVTSREPKESIVYYSSTCSFWGNFFIPSQHCELSIWFFNIFFRRTHIPILCFSINHFYVYSIFPDERVYEWGAHRVLCPFLRLGRTAV